MLMQHFNTQISYEVSFISKDPCIDIIERTSRIKAITEKLNSKVQFSEWPSDIVRGFYTNSEQTTSTLRFTFIYVIEGRTEETNEKVYDIIKGIQIAFDELQFNCQVEIGMSVDTSFSVTPELGMI